MCVCVCVWHTRQSFSHKVLFSLPGNGERFFLPFHTETKSSQAGVEDSHFRSGPDVGAQAGCSPKLWYHQGPRTEAPVTPSGPNLPVRSLSATCPCPPNAVTTPGLLISFSCGFRGCLLTYLRKEGDILRWDFSSDFARQ